MGVCVLMLWCAELCVVCRGDVCVPLVLHRKRSRVYLQNARVTKDTDVLNNVHTERLSLLFSRLSSLVSLSLLLVSLSFFLFSLSNNDNDHSSSRLSVYAQL